MPSIQAPGMPLRSAMPTFAQNSRLLTFGSDNDPTGSVPEGDAVPSGDRFDRTPTVPGGSDVPDTRTEDEKVSAIAEVVIALTDWWNEAPQGSRSDEAIRRQLADADEALRTGGNIRPGFEKFNPLDSLQIEVSFWVNQQINRRGK